MGYPRQGRRGKRDGYRMNALRVIQAGSVPYQEALEWQRTLAEDRIAGQLAHDVLLLLEHPPVVTLGRNSHAAHLLRSSGIDERSRCAACEFRPRVTTGGCSSNSSTS